MSIFSTLKSYSTPWNVKSCRPFTEEEQKEVLQAKVVESNYGLSVCFHMRRGGTTFIPLSTKSSLSVGDEVDLGKASLLTLGKVGEDDILRVEV